MIAWREHVKICYKPVRVYSDVWDAFYCATCNVWVEGKCGCSQRDGPCPYNCSKRPATPLWSP